MTTTPYFLCTIWSPVNKFSAHLAQRPYMFNSSLFCLPSFCYDLFISRVTRPPRTPSHFFFAPERKWRRRKRMNLWHTFSSEDTQLSITTIKSSQLNFKHGRSDNYVCAKNPHFQNEARCTFLVKMSFIMKSHFHTKG